MSPNEILKLFKTLNSSPSTKNIYKEDHLQLAKELNDSIASLSGPSTKAQAHEALGMMYQLYSQSDFLRKEISLSYLKLARSHYIQTRDYYEEKPNYEYLICVSLYRELCSLGAMLAINNNDKYKNIIINFLEDKKISHRVKNMKVYESGDRLNKIVRMIEGLLVYERFVAVDQMRQATKHKIVNAVPESLAEKRMKIANSSTLYSSTSSSTQTNINVQISTDSAREDFILGQNGGYRSSKGPKKIEGFTSLGRAVSVKLKSASEKNIDYYNKVITANNYTCFGEINKNLSFILDEMGKMQKRLVHIKPESVIATEENIILLEKSDDIVKFKKGLKDGCEHKKKNYPSTQSFESNHSWYTFGYLLGYQLEKQSLMRIKDTYNAIAKMFSFKNFTDIAANFNLIINILTGKEKISDRIASRNQVEQSIEKTPLPSNEVIVIDGNEDNTYDATYYEELEQALFEDTSSSLPKDDSYVSYSLFNPPTNATTSTSTTQNQMLPNNLSELN